MRYTVLITIASLFLAAGSIAVAEETDPLESEAPSFSSPTVTPLVRLGLAVVSISAIGWGLTVWARRRHTKKGGDHARIQVLANRSLGPRHQVALLEVGDHRLLVGMGGDAIVTLADLTAGVEFSEEFERTLPRRTEAGRRSLVDVIGPFEGLDV
jgi:flagellar biogenesis protein FliO